MNIVSLVTFAGTLILSLSTMPVNKKQSKSLKDGFAVVELFTSEGCSSCPPADAVLQDIQKKYKDGVFVLGFHVDYWNYLGWKDEFSAAAYSERQKKYAQMLNLNSIYTPQAIVNGQTEFNGSDEDRLNAVIKSQLETKTNTSISLQAVQSDNSKIELRYQLEGNFSSKVLNIALVQNTATHQVLRGENAGRSLNHTNAVRNFQIIKIAGSEGNISVPIAVGFKPADYHIIGYVQDPGSLRVLAASSTAITGLTKN